MPAYLGGNPRTGSGEVLWGAQRRAITLSGLAADHPLIRAMLPPLAPRRSFKNVPLERPLVGTRETATWVL